jgi:hypothetical protein
MQDLKELAITSAMVRNRPGYFLPSGNHVNYLLPV